MKDFTATIEVIRDEALAHYIEDVRKEYLVYPAIYDLIEEEVMELVEMGRVPTDTITEIDFHHDPDGFLEAIDIRPMKPVAPEKMATIVDDGIEIPF